MLLHLPLLLPLLALLLLHISASCFWHQHINR